MLRRPTGRNNRPLPVIPTRGPTSPRRTAALFLVTPAPLAAATNPTVATANATTQHAETQSRLSTDRKLGGPPSAMLPRGDHARADARWVREIDRTLRQAHIRPSTAASRLAEDEQEARALT